MYFPVAPGKTGKLAVEGLLRRGKAVRAVTRTGDFSLKQDNGDSDLITTAAGDVTKTDTLKQALAGCKAVLFCASASKVCVLWLGRRVRMGVGQGHSTNSNYFNARLVAPCRWVREAYKASSVLRCSRKLIRCLFWPALSLFAVIFYESWR